MTAPDNTSPAAPPGVCPRCAGTHAEGDAETGERLPCTACFGMPLRPAGLDLDVDEVDLTAPIAPMEPREAETWLAEIDAARGDCDPSAEARAGYRIEAALRGLLQQRSVRDAAAQAFDDLVAQVWRATGETHEPPADVAALLRRVTLRGEQLAHAITETATVRRALCDAEERESNLRVDVVNARREGAEAMREACDAEAVRVTSAWARRERVATTPGLSALACGEEITERIRALPLPGGEP